MGKERKEQALRRKNFLPTLLIIAFLWLGVVGLIYFVDPETFGVIPLFFILVFFAELFTFSTIFANSRRGLITTLGLSVFLILLYLGIGNILNFLLMAGIAITIELYFWKTA